MTGTSSRIDILVRVQKTPSSLHSVKGLGKCTRALEKGRRVRLKTREMKHTQGKSILSSKDIALNLGESAAVHFVHGDLARISDATGENDDDDPAVVRTVEELAVTGSDAPAQEQEKEARSSGGIQSR